MRPTILGPGKLYRSPLATANPDESTIDFDEAWGGSWIDMGDFPEGSQITVSIKDTIYKVYSERKTTARAVTRTRREAMAKGALLDHTPANMAIALQGTAETTPAAGGGQKGFTEIPFGSQSEVDLYKWGVEGHLIDDDGNKQPVRWFFHQGFFMTTSEISYSKTKESMIGFEIHIIGDDDQAAGEDLGILQLVTDQATGT
jgi:hypothetical protein